MSEGERKIQAAQVPFALLGSTANPSCMENCLPSTDPAPDPGLAFTATLQADQEPCWKPCLPWEMGWCGGDRHNSQREVGFDFYSKHSPEEPAGQGAYAFTF